MPRRPTLVACLAATVLLGGCQLVQRPTPQPAAPTATPSATPVVPSGEPTPSPTPTADQVAIAAFLRRITSSDLRYQATFQGDARGAISVVTTKGRIDVVGRNYSLFVDFSFTAPRYTERVEHRYVGGKAWLRRNGRWSRFTSFLAERSMSPFAAIVDASDVTFLGVVRAKGTIPERYRIEIPTGFFHPLMIPSTNVYVERIDRSKLELVIEANGVPVAGTSTISARARVGGQLQEVVIQANLAFRALGSTRIVVRAP